MTSPEEYTVCVCVSVSVCLSVFVCVCVCVWKRRWKPVFSIADSPVKVLILSVQKSPTTKSWNESGGILWILAFQGNGGASGLDKFFFIHYQVWRLVHKTQLSVLGFWNLWRRYLIAAVPPDCSRKISGSEVKFSGILLYEIECRQHFWKRLGYGNCIPPHPSPTSFCFEETPAFVQRVSRTHIHIFQCMVGGTTGPSRRGSIQNTWQSGEGWFCKSALSPESQLEIYGTLLVAFQGLLLLASPKQSQHNSFQTEQHICCEVSFSVSIFWLGSHGYMQGEMICLTNEVYEKKHCSSGREWPQRQFLPPKVPFPNFQSRILNTVSLVTCKLSKYSFHRLCEIVEFWEHVLFGRCYLFCLCDVVPFVRVTAWRIRGIFLRVETALQRAHLRLRLRLVFAFRCFFFACKMIEGTRSWTYSTKVIAFSSKHMTNQYQQLKRIFCS